MRVSMSLFASFFFAFVLFATQSSYAATDLKNPSDYCTRVLQSRNGTVMAGGPAKMSIVPTSDELTVKIIKKDGKAQTIVNIYVNNQKRTDIVFNNGNYSDTKSKTISNVRGKTVRIDIVNQSIGNKFEYTAQFIGESTDLGGMQGNIFGQDQKTETLSIACKNRVRIVINRTGGNARANVYVKLGGQTIETRVFDKDQNKMTIELTNTQAKGYTVQVKNVSTANWFKFTMDADTY